MSKRREFPTEEPYALSLTSKDSHTVVIERGQGSFSIGPKSEDGKICGKLDAIVDPDVPILWDVFSEFYTLKEWPWPRWMNYLGNDSSFIEWSKKRPISYFYWRPYKNQTIDLEGAQIHDLTIEALEDVKIKISNIAMDDSSLALSLSGYIENFEIENSHLKEISMGIKLSKDSKKSAYQLPTFKSLSDIESIGIGFPVVGQAFDCKSLIQFSHLKTLKLSGNLVNLECLSNFLNLETLELSHCPNLEGLPPLDTWSKLGYVLACNVEEKNGKILRSQIRKLSKMRKMYVTYNIYDLKGPTKEAKLHSGVSKLRSKEWFLEECGLPFSGWPRKNERIAGKAYKNAAKIITEAKKEIQVKKAILEFVEVINKLKDIETSERDDTGVAIKRLAQIKPDLVSVDKAMEWFDEIRDF